MTRDKIERLFTECKAVSKFAKESGLYFAPDLYGFTVDDLRLAAEIYGGEVEYCASADEPFHYLEIEEVTLYA